MNKGDKNLLISVSGFILAIFISSFIKLGFSFFLLLIICSIAIFTYKRYFIHDYFTDRKIFLIIIFISFFAFGVLRYEIKDSVTLDDNLENNVGNKVTLMGIVEDEPARKEKQTVLTVKFKEIIISSSTIPISGRGLVSTDLYPEFQYGDEVSISGKLERPENFGTSTFDYASYLAKDDIFYTVNFAKTSLISSGHGNIIKANLFKFKNAFIGNTNKVIPEPEASLLSGILLGAKSSIDEKTTGIFRTVGLSHIVALSGYNITIVAEAIMRTLSFLPRNFAFSGGILGIMLFVMMSGASSTAIRAGIMALIVMFAGLTHRKYDIGRALVLAGVLMIIINPKILVFDLSFQLSFLATIAIIYVSPILKGKFKFITDKFGLRDTVSATISAQILVLPLILHQMGLLSLVALPANILVLAFIPTTMFFGFVTGIIGFISIPLSLPFAWISWLLLSYMVKISELFASLPFSSVNISWFPTFIMAICYILIMIWVFNERKRNENI
ncbi:MAG: ComEC/Rec2 family competence protein [Candidatus Paceibacterota bacterium]|jgi:competence protein ComEC